MLNIICPKCKAKKWVYSGYKKRPGEPKSQRFLCKGCNREFTDTDILSQFGDNVDIEMLRENIRLSKEKQHFSDRNRIERKAYREYARIDNAVSEYNRKLLLVLSRQNLAKFTMTHRTYNGSAAGILHLTDTHFNELVELNNNKYDFEVAAKRLQLFVAQARDYFLLKGVKNMLLAMTGDLLNSDRRLDELLSQSTNRSKATFLATRLIELMILDLNKDFNVSVANVTGNESRMSKDIAWTDMMATDNYDFTIFNILQFIFRDAPGISFVANGDPMEQVVQVGGKNILLMHGHQRKLRANVESGVAVIKGKYASRGIKIDFVIFGHLHSARIGDMYARGGSLIGANEYSDRALQLQTKASQNIHIIYENGGMDSIKIDLQNIEDVEGYSIKRGLEAYNAKSSVKALDKKAIFRVII